MNPSLKKPIQLVSAVCDQLRAFTLVCLTLFLTSSLTAAGDSNPLDAIAKDQVDVAVDKAIKYLLTLQEADGSIDDRRNDAAMTSLAIMAMAATGNQPIDPTPQGKSLRRALDFVLKEDRQDQNGYFGNRDGSRMYGHGIITLMLSEMLGMGLNDKQDKLTRERCQKAIDLILRSQKYSKNWQHKGGWRYTPDSRDADLSVSVWQLMALRSAKNSGLKVPSTSIQEAIEYLKRSYRSSLDSKGNPTNKKSAFAYQPGGAPEFTMAAAGILAMQVCGEYESPFVHGAADWLLDHPPAKHQKFFFYGTYYYSQGMYQRGGEHAKIARKNVEDILLKLQTREGSWQGTGSEGGAGKVYSTSLAVLALAVKYHYLPIYQR